MARSSVLWRQYRSRSIDRLRQPASSIPAPAGRFVPMSQISSGAEWLALFAIGLVNTVIAVVLLSTILQRLIGARTGATRTAVVALALVFVFMPLSALVLLPE